MAMVSTLMENMDVADVYSPPRVAAMARRIGHRAGWSLDRTICDIDGHEWDFNSMEVRNCVARKFLRGKPFVLIGSLMRSPFGVMNNTGYSRMDPVLVKQHMDYGRSHFRFCAKLYKLHMEQG